MRLRNEDFSLTPSERAVYGATITAKSLDNGDTLTIARTGMDGGRGDPRDLRAAR